MKTQSVFHWAITLATGALLTACGNIGPAYQYGMTSNADALDGGVGSTTSGGGLSSANGLYQCPSQGSNNVVPMNFQSYFGGAYRACQDPNSQADVLLVGAARNNDPICVFPATTAAAGGQQSLTWIANPNAAGAPWYVCQAASASGTIFNFQGVSWNAAIVVDQADVGVMQACLVYGPGTPMCPYYPDYSSGVFR